MGHSLNYSTWILLKFPPGKFINLFLGGSNLFNTWINRQSSAYIAPASAVSASGHSVTETCLYFRKFTDSCQTTNSSVTMGHVQLHSAVRLVLQAQTSSTEAQFITPQNTFPSFLSLYATPCDAWHYTCWYAEVDSTFGGGRSTFTWVLYLSALFESVIIIFFWKPMTFTSLLWLRQISFFSLHYISIKILEVERCYHVAALKVSGWIFFFSIFFSDSLSVITLVVTLHCRKEHGVESNWESLY